MLSRQYYNELDVRKRQIDTLKIFNDHVVEINENSEYRVEFLAEGKNMSLTVILSPEFPIDKPSIYINPLISHPWVPENTNQVVGAPGLLNYTLHSDLGRVVQAIIREFQRSMPRMSNNDDIAITNDISPQSQCSGQSLMFPELNDWSVEELQRILENTDLQDKILETNPQLVELEQESEELINSIEQIAQENIAKQELLDGLKNDVVDRISTIVQMKMNFEEMHRRHQKLAELSDPYKIRECLREAVQKDDEESEIIADQFLMGNIPVDTFVTRFAEKRASGQSRRAREERLTYQLALLDIATTNE